VAKQFLKIALLTRSTIETDMQKLGFEVQLPENERNLPIYEEYFWLSQNGTKRKLKLHDYVEVYQIPYLYEQIMEKLHCQSFSILPSLLVEQVTQAGGKVEDLVVLDVGAGTGMVGQNLARLGIKSITGIDILPEAAEAAKREYPGIYEEYYVEDLTNLSEAACQTLNSRRFNCLVCCSALSSTHVPANALSAALNVVIPNGWIAFNIAKDTWEDQGMGGFVQQNPWVTKTDMFELVATHSYQHRIHIDGRSLEYVAIIGRKRSSFVES